MPRRRQLRERRVSSSESETEADTESATAAVATDGCKQASASEEANTASNTAISTGSVKERIEELKYVQKQRERRHGIDVYSLAIGESNENEAKLLAKNQQENDPWKTKTGGLVDMRRIKEKRGNEIVKNMNNNFAKETNQRDEDAEMQKFIEEQLRLKKEAEQLQSKLAQEQLGIGSGMLSAAEVAEAAQAAAAAAAAADARKFKTPADALFDVPKYLIESHSKPKSEESLSEQMLSGIPEVDLGMGERVRNIEDTERAKQRMLAQRQQMQAVQTAAVAVVNEKAVSARAVAGADAVAAALDPVAAANLLQYAPQNTSMNFVQHKRFDDALINPDHMIKPRMLNGGGGGGGGARAHNKQQHEQQPVVGDAPKHALLVQAAYNQQQERQARLAGRFGGGRRGGGRPMTGNANHHRHQHRVVSATDDQARQNAAAKRPHTGAPAHHHHHHAGGSSSNAGGVERASDDFCLERFKKNMRFSRNSKIKIA